MNRHILSSFILIKMVFLHDSQNQSKKKEKSFSKKNIFQLPFNEYAKLFHVCSASG